MKLPKIAIALTGVIIIGLYFYYRWRPLTTRVIFDRGVIYADVAITDQQKEKGLGGRNILPSDRGMLFVFTRTDKYPFWMKGMKFPLDFVWMYGNQVTEITQNIPVTTSGRITTVFPTKPVDKVLEVNAGTVARLGIQAGSTFIIRN